MKAVFRRLMSAASYPIPAPPPSLFSSFWIAGFESATHVTRTGARLDMLAVTQHDRQVAEDYALLHRIGISTARDAVRWHLIERDGRFDFSTLAPMVRAAREQDVQVIWTLCHYGWPHDVDPMARDFPERFARFCAAAARFVTAESNAIPFFSPINEISFLTWAVDVGIFSPFARGRGAEFKRQLVRAAIAGIEAIWSVDRRARIVHVDPIINVVPPRERPELAGAALGQTNSQYEAWDMLSGRMAPELGGHPRYLDIIGVNFYHANQWEYPDRRIRWEDTPRDDRWVPLHLLLERIWKRYRCQVFIGETSHFGVGRAPWLREVTAEVLQARTIGVPIEGICLYPILDRPDWENLQHWHHSGLWELLPDRQGHYHRVLNEIYAAELRRAQRTLPEPSPIDPAR
jgi:hypothetical protein